MTRETKFGLLLVLTLTSVFGFLVWKKMHQPKDLVATTQSAETTEDAGETPPEEAESPVNDASTVTPLVAIPTERIPPRRPVTPPESTPRSEELFSPQTPAVTRSKSKLPVDLDQDFFSAPPKNARTAAVTESRTAATEPDPFAPAVETQNTIPVTTPVEEPNPFGVQDEPVAVGEKNAATEPDPFAESPSATSRVAMPAETEAAAPAGNELDPFSRETIEVPARQPVVIEMPAESTEPIALEEPSVSTLEVPAERATPPAQRVDFNAENQARNELVDAYANASNQPPVEISARSSVPVTAAAVAAEVVEPALEIPARAEPVATPTRSAVASQEPDPFFDEVKVPEPVRAIPTPRSQPPIRMAAPVTDPDPFGVPAEIPSVPMRAEPFPVRAERAPQRHTGRTSPPVAFSGETYIVQPNDNFWTISKKVYGSGRYFEALAQHNTAVVPDPAKMKPGLKIATPTAVELQARFPKLLATAGMQDTVQDPVSLGLPGDVYVAQSGDNFWEISKRLYGDGKYFRALEQHNAAIVNDPQKLKPGMKLAAPKAAWLHAKYPQLIATAASAVQDLRRTQPDRYQPDEPAGFFVGPGEQPMFRVGTRDTLSDIAQTYLGRSSRWIQIYQMNRDVLTDGNALNVGTVLKLPADASRVVLIEDGSPRR